MKKRSIPQSIFDTPQALKAAKEGHLQACRELNDTPRHLLGEGNPNHPMYDNKLFGYDEKKFLRKQYR